MYRVCCTNDESIACLFALTYVSASKPPVAIARTRLCDRPHTRVRTRVLNLVARACRLIGLLLWFSPNHTCCPLHYPKQNLTLLPRIVNFQEISWGNRGVNGHMLANVRPHTSSPPDFHRAPPPYTWRRFRLPCRARLTAAN